MISQQITDNMTTATAAWVTAAALELDEDRMNVFKRCTEMGGADIRVTVALRAGTLILDAVIEAVGRRAELFRQDVDPLRLRRFASSESKGEHWCALAVTRGPGRGRLLGWSRKPPGQNAFRAARQTTLAKVRF